MRSVPSIKSELELDLARARVARAEAWSAVFSTDPHDLSGWVKAGSKVKELERQIALLEASAASKPVRPSAAKKTPVPEAAIVAFLERRKLDWEQTGFPNRDIVEQEAVKELGPGVNRTMLRGLYRKVKPPDLRGPGRPRENWPK